MNNRANRTSFQKGHGKLRTNESYKKAGTAISLAKTGKKRPPVTKEYREKMSIALKGRKIEWADAISRAKAGDNYGLSTQERYLKKLESKAGRTRPDKCEVCNRLGKIYFDHSHDTGKFRGWLCVKCNNTLGMADDNPKILRALADYAEHHA